MSDHKIDWVLDMRDALCDHPPEGWVCTRDRGHDGPCAAYPESEIKARSAVEVRHQDEPMAPDRLQMELRGKLSSALHMKERARVEPKVITQSFEWWEGKVCGLEEALQALEGAELV